MVLPTPQMVEQLDQLPAVQAQPAALKQGSEGAGGSPGQSAALPDGQVTWRVRLPAPQAELQAPHSEVRHEQPSVA